MLCQEGLPTPHPQGFHMLCPEESHIPCQEQFHMLCRLLRVHRRTIPYHQALLIVVVGTVCLG